MLFHEVLPRRITIRMANARAAGAETIDVAWHPGNGYPISCYIDEDPFLADEEQGWTIYSFTPLP